MADHLTAGEMEDQHMPKSKRYVGRPVVIYTSCSESLLLRVLGEGAISWLASVDDTILTTEDVLPEALKLLDALSVGYRFDLPEVEFAYGGVVGLRPTLWGWELYDAAGGGGRYEWL